MARTMKTSAEIQKIVRELVHNIETVKEDGAVIAVAMPQEVAPGADGCNWDMSHFGNASGYVEAIQQVLHQARQQYQLQT